MKIYEGEIHTGYLKDSETTASHPLTWEEKKTSYERRDALSGFRQFQKFVCKKARILV